MQKFYVYFLAFMILGGFTIAIQEAQAAVNSVTINNIANNNRISGSFTIQVTVADSGGNTATSGTIVFTRTGGTADATSPHTYNMAVGEYGTSGSFTKTRAELETGFTNSLVDGTTYTITASVVDGATSTATVTGITYDTSAPTMNSASVTSSTTIQVNFSEDLADGSISTSDFTLSDGLTVSGFSESNGVVTLTTSAIPTGSTPTVTLANDGVTDVINVGTVNTLSAGSSVVATNNLGGGGGDGCNGDCEEPTLGIDERGNRLVSNGFTYNGHAVDVERFFTPYPLITAQVGKQNIAEFKIYENRGPDNIRHFTFAFGLDKGDVISESKARIELDRDYDGTETVTVYDPENALDNVKVSTNTVSCSDDSNLPCLNVKIQHMFRAPLDFNIVATDVWDFSRQSWQNYYNHGIEVVGESLNPPQEFSGIAKGHIYHLTEISKTTAIDEFGNNWTFKYNKWQKDFIKNERIPDADSVFTRMHSDFANAKTDESDKATKTLLVLCPTCLDPYADFEDSKSIPHSERVDRMNDPRVIQIMKLESERATKIVEYLLHPSHYSQ